MHNNPIPAYSVKKGRLLEYIVTEVLLTIKDTLFFHNINCGFNYYRKGGRTHSEVDFEMWIDYQSIRYTFYIEVKNQNNTQLDKSLTDEKIFNKFQYMLSEHDGYSKNVEKLIVGNIVLCKADRKRVEESGIYYMNSGELKLNSDEADIGEYVIDLETQLVHYLSQRIAVFSTLASDLEVEIIDYEKFAILQNGKQIQEYSVKQISDGQFVYPGKRNWDFFKLKKGRNGGIQLISPWKGKSSNSKLSVKNLSKNTFLNTIQWGLKRKKSRTLIVENG